MHTRTSKGIVWLALAWGLSAGCEGPAGPAGAMGAPGEMGEPGEPGEPGASPVVDPALAPLDKAVLAMGGRAALDALASLEIEGTGTRWMTLEGAHPEDGAVLTGSFTVTVHHDVAGDRWRLDYARSNAIFGAMTSFAEILDGETGAVSGTESVFGIPGGTMTSDRWAATRKQQRLLLPQLVLRAALADPASVRDAGLAVEDGELRHLVEIADDVAPLTLWIDVDTGRLTKLTTRENDHVSGDVPVQVSYASWQPADDGAVLFPRDVAITVGGEPAHLEHRTAVRTGAGLDPALFTLPDGTGAAPVAEDAARGERNHQFVESFAALGVPLDGLQTTIDAERLTGGVYHLRGGSHHSLAIEQSAGVVIVEAPLYEARAEAILDWVAATFPTKRVTHLVLTHHHRDHVGAFRTFVARGATLVTGEASASFFVSAARAARTIEPDELAAMPARANVITVPAGGRITLDDSLHPVVVQAIDTVHAADMVAVVVPGEEIAFASDLFSPGFPPVPFYAGELHQGLTDSGLPIARIAGGHGAGVGTLADLRTAAGLD